MAKRIVDEEMKFDIIINGNSAQKELMGLEKETRRLTQENKALGLQKKLLEKQNKTESAEYKALTATIKDNSKEITANKARMSELQKQIGINSLTMAQLTKRAGELRLAIRNTIPGSADNQRYTAELNTINTRLGQLRGNAQAAKFSLSSLADGFNKYQAMAASFLLVITGVVLSIQKMIDYNGKLADAQANVMKTTKMTKAEVDELTKSFGLFQTRTSRIDLLKIAEEGGRIGIAKDDIASFTEEMNKANVALGDSFSGGASEVASKLGKLKFLFRETKDMDVGEAYNKIGSAINELGAAGVASEANIADFATRLGSMNDALKPSIQEALALGAAFEESGIESEVAARAYSIFLNQASTNTGKFAKVMNLTQKQVKDMINDNPMEFFLKFSERLQGMDATDVATTLDYLGVSADGANKALGAVANNGKRFRDQINLSNEAYDLGTSLTEEYAIKNNNLAATLEKIKKTATGWFSSEGFIDWLESAVNWIGKFLGATDDADGSGARWRNGLFLTAKILAVLIASLIGFNAGLRLAALLTNGVTMSTTLLNIAVKAQAIGIAFARLGLVIYTSVMGFFGVATDKASASLARLNLVSKASPWGALLAIVTAVIVAYAVFSERTKESATRLSILNDTMREADAIVAKETKSLQNLIAVAKDKNASDEARKAAIEEINRRYPEYLGHLTLENINTAEGTKLIDQYIKSLHKKAEMHILEARQAALVKQISEKKKQSLEEEIDLLDQAWSYMKNFGDVSRTSADLTVTATNRKTTALKKLQAELKLTDAEMEKMLKANPDLIPEADGDKISTYSIPTPEEDKGAAKVAKKAEDERQRRLDALERFRSELLAAERKTIDDRLALMEEGFEKEMAIENENHRRKLEDLKLQLTSENALANLDKEINKATKSGDKGKAGELIAQKEHWKKMNGEINKQIEMQDQIHSMKISTIIARQETDLIKKADDKFNREKLLRETAHNLELAALGENEEAKERLRKEFADAELKYDEEYLLTKIDQLNQMLSGQTLDGIDFSLLTPAQKDKITEDLEVVRNALAKLQATKNGEPTEDTPSAGRKVFGDTDILGFTADQWESTFKNLGTLEEKLAAANMIVSGMQNLWGAYNDFVSAGEARSLKKYEQGQDARKRKLKQQLDNGEINQGQYKKKLEALDQDLEKKRAELDYNKAKREKQMALVGAIINTAKGVAAALPNIFLAAIAGAMGALQIATIARQPLPAKGFEDGLYPVQREQDGKMFNARYGGTTTSGVVKKPTYFLTGENGPEMILDSRVYSNMNPEVRNSVHREIARIKGYESGLYPSQVPAPTYSGDSTAAPNDTLFMAMAAALNRNSEIMEKIERDGIPAHISTKDRPGMDKLRKAQEEATKRRDLNKI